MTDLDEQAIEAAAKANCPDVQMWEAQSESRIQQARVIVDAYLAACGSLGNQKTQDALEQVSEFLERVAQWTGSDPDEVHEVTQAVDAALVDLAARGSSDVEEPDDEALNLISTLADALESSEDDQDPLQDASDAALLDEADRFLVKHGKARA